MPGILAALCAMAGMIILVLTGISVASYGAFVRRDWIPLGLGSALVVGGLATVAL